MQQTVKGVIYMFASGQSLPVPRVNKFGVSIAPIIWTNYLSAYCLL